ncbi:hypothetical protein [Xylanibacter muris]|uniref:Uncharacterized protein n=1 Tax=Xylanibacter muris TaxID=2736290 RepID=A0ABX2APE3_9BACT|nr:hypothetical protein [Xylanibacter muris]NPD91796.1 hypothetical protein [Xylanibacter muris]
MEGREKREGRGRMTDRRRAYYRKREHIYYRRRIYIRRRKHIYNVREEERDGDGGAAGREDDEGRKRGETEGGAGTTKEGKETAERAHGHRKDKRRHRRDF